MTSAQTPASMLEMQHQIRANAANLQDYFSELYSWEKAIGKEDASRRRGANMSSKSGGDSSMPPPRAPQSATISSAGANDSTEGERTKQPDAHTYDKGYKRWDKFDVEAALREADGDAQTHKEEALEEPPRKVRTTASTTRKASAQTVEPLQVKSRAEIEKQEGNEHYKRGDYVAAIKSYTRCLGFDAQNPVVLSNRAMAFLKNREFAKAEDDCSLALKVDPLHVKSFLRRGSARNALGKHRLALLDFGTAAELDPKNRQAQSQLAATRDLVRTAIKRSPKRTEFQIQVVGSPVPVANAEPVKLEIVEDDGHEDKENTAVQHTKVTTNDSNGDAVKPVETSSSSKQPPVRVLQLPSLPKKAPTTAYEFTRVWKTLTPKGDTERRSQLLDLRARYLRLVPPTSLRGVFKNSIESELLCEIFAVFRQSTLPAASPSRNDLEFVLKFAQELARVPRFSMTVMFLSDKEKEDVKWVVDKVQSATGDVDIQAIAQLKKAYELS